MSAEKGFMVAIVTHCATTRKDHTVVPANQSFMETEKTAALVGSFDIIGLLKKLRKLQTKSA